MTSQKLRFTVAVALFALSAVSIQAQNQLTNGSGPGSVSVRVDGWGMFGGCPNQSLHSDGQFTSSAGFGPFATTCYSAIILDDSGGCASPGRTQLAVADPLYTQIPAQAVNPVVTVLNPQHIQTASPQTVCGLQVSVDQRLDGPDPLSGSFEGSTLVQTYTITNPTANTRVFNLIHFIDGDLSALFTANRGGASRRLADCALTLPPFASNKEWVFEFDQTNTPGVLLAISADGKDEVGQPVQTVAYRVHASAVGHPSPTFTANPFAFLTNSIDNDSDGDLLVSSPEAQGDFAMFQGLSFTVTSGGTVTAVFRTRWTSLDSTSATSLESQARDVTCSTQNGNYSGNGIGPLLCINGQGGCASIGLGQAFNISLGATAAGPAPTHYLLFGIFGQPVTGSACGSPTAGDATLWGPPFGNLGLGAFPVSSSLATWTGGGGALGIPLISSLPGLALITGPMAAGTLGCGGVTLVTVPGVLPNGISVTLQAAVIDGGGATVTLSNAATFAIGCPCPTH